jgi:hypothetical protein
LSSLHSSILETDLWLCTSHRPLPLGNFVVKHPGCTSTRTSQVFHLIYMGIFGLSATPKSGLLFK